MLLSRCSIATSLRKTNNAERCSLMSTARSVRREAILWTSNAGTRQLALTTSTTSKPRRPFSLSASASNNSSSSESVVHLKVEGMVCSKCTDRVENALMGVEGVSDARADLSTGDVKIIVGSGDDSTSAASLAALVEETGFGATVVQE